MRYLETKLAIAILGMTSAAMGQQQTASHDSQGMARADLAIGYNYIHSNAPPGGCRCFSMNGGFLSGDLRVVHWLSLAAQITGNHATKISTLGQNLTLTTFLAGPRISIQFHRVTPFAEAMFGAARGTGSYFPTAASSTTSASSFALGTGGGLDIELSKHLALRALDVQYLRSSLPNGSDDTQNELQLSTGLVFRFKLHGQVKPLPPAPPQPRQISEIAFTCSASAAQVTAGDAVQIVGQTLTLPDRLDVNYSWATNAGTVDGNGRMVMIDTSGLLPGVYRVDGRATLVSDPNVSATCQAAFRVKHAKTLAGLAPAPAAIVVPQTRVDDFAEHVHDVFFDYDKSRIRRDAREALAEDAAYLAAHPDMHIAIAGYADERGTADYNIALGLKRANAVLNALVALGIDTSRMHVLSYGKEKPFCSDNTDACYRSNRRAQLIHDN